MKASFARSERVSLFMSSADATLESYDAQTTAKMVGLSAARLRAWARVGLLQPSVEVDGQRRYSFQDLVALRCAKSLVERGVSLASIRRGIEQLKANAPGELSASCLARHRTFAIFGKVGVRSEGRTHHPSSGQMCLAFGDSPELAPLDSTGSGDSDSASLLRFPNRRVGLQDHAPLEPAQHDCAETWYAFGVDCESLWNGESPTDIYFRRAQRAYLVTVERQPDHAPAWTNLGTLHAAVGDACVARAYYEQALSHDPKLSEPLCNLAELDMREGAFEPARIRFSKVLEQHPGHLEAMYGLARAHIALDEHAKAVSLLIPYCERLEALHETELDDELEARLQGAKLVIETYQRSRARQQEPARPKARRELTLVSGNSK